MNPLQCPLESVMTGTIVILSRSSTTFQNGSWPFICLNPLRNLTLYESWHSLEKLNRYVPFFLHDRYLHGGTCVYAGSGVVRAFAKKRSTQ